MNITPLTHEDVRSLFRIPDLRDLMDLLPHDLYADSEDGGRAAFPEHFGLESLGLGRSAVVMTHPDDPDLVIRVCEEGDGWVAVSERFHAITPEAASDFVDSLWSTVQPARPAKPATPEMASLMADAQDRHLLLDDIEPRNILRRTDGTIVLNDPLSFMSADHLRDFKARFTPSPETADLSI